MDTDLWRMVVSLTPPKPYRDGLDRSKLQALAKNIRADNDQYPALVSFLEKRTQHHSSQVLFLTLQLIHYFFVRSAHFRAAFCKTYFMGILTRFYENDKPPETFVSRIHNCFNIVIQQWSENFSNIYPQLRYLEHQFPPKTEELTIWQKKNIKSTEQEVLAFKNEYNKEIEEVERLLKLIEDPKCENDEEPTSEYMDLLKENLAYHRKSLEECIQKVDYIKARAESKARGTVAAAEINILSFLVSDIYQKAMNVGMDNDDFEEVVSDEDE